MRTSGWDLRYTDIKAAKKSRRRKDQNEENKASKPVSALVLAELQTPFYIKQPSVLLRVEDLGSVVAAPNTPSDPEHE